MTTKLVPVKTWRIKVTGKAPRRVCCYWELECGHVMPVSVWQVGGMGQRQPAVEGVSVACHVCERNRYRRALDALIDTTAVPRPAIEFGAIWHDLSTGETKEWNGHSWEVIPDAE